jgi:hypothetical protein
LVNISKFSFLQALGARTKKNHAMSVVPDTSSNKSDAHVNEEMVRISTPIKSYTPLCFKDHVFQGPVHNKKHQMIVGWQIHDFAC